MWAVHRIRKVVMGLYEWIVKYWIEWAFGLLIAALTAYCRHISKALKKEKDEHKALRDGMRSLLKRNIIEDCEKAISDGYCSAATKDTIEDMYESYHALGGNGVVTRLKDQMLDLPTVKGD